MDDKKVVQRSDDRRNSRRPGGNRRGNRQEREQAPKQFEEVVINVDRVSRVVKGGRRFRFKALVAVGDKKNRVGVGVAKGGDVQVAIAKATDVAKKNMIVVPIANDTIPHDIEIKVTGSQVLLKPAAPGTGIIAGGVIRSIIGLTGIKNLLTKSLGSSNKVNIAYATIEALEALVPREKWLKNTNNSKSESKIKPEKEAKKETK